MDIFEIQGGRRLFGEITIAGAKNACLPLMTAALLTDAPVVLHDVPDLADLRSMVGLLETLGCDIQGMERGARSSSVTFHSTDESQSHAEYEIVRTMRASISTLGPMLARRGYARVAMPGGCLIGTRPVDLHLQGLRALGANIDLVEGDIIARAPAAGLKGGPVFMGGPFGTTVLGTANVLSAATLARGTTIIECAACEPEIVDLANLLCSMGARITGAGTPRITVEGVEKLHGAQHRVIADRIEAATFMCAAAITNGDITLRNCPLDALYAVSSLLESVGVHIERCDSGSDPMRVDCRVTSDRILRAAHVTTQPHPGLPTDAQAQIMALLCLADGNSIVTEKIFPERFMHVPELARMGAQLYRQGPTVVISGVRQLIGAPVMASDLRASASLVLAGLAASGTTTIQRVYHLDRGYHRMEESLKALGAEISRMSDDSRDAPIARVPIADSATMRSMQGRN